MQNGIGLSPVFVTSNDVSNPFSVTSCDTLSEKANGYCLSVSSFSVSSKTILLSVCVTTENSLLFANPCICLSKYFMPSSIESPICFGRISLTFASLYFPLICVILSSHLKV